MSEHSLAQMAAEMPPELREILAELAGSGVEIRSPEDLERLLDDRPDLREKLEELVGAQRAAPAVPPQFLPDLRRAQEGVTHYQQTGDLAALNDAVAAWERVLNHPAFPQADERFRLAAMNDAGGACLRRYEATGHLPDLGRAMALWQEAIARTTEGSPDWASMQANLGGALLRRFEALGEVADLDAAIGAYEKALGVFSPQVFPDYTLRAALPLGRLLFRRRGQGDMARAVEAYRPAQAAARDLYFRALRPSRRQRELGRAQQIPAHYAYALASQGRLEEAVEALEAGRARQLAEALLSARVQQRFREDTALQSARERVEAARIAYNHAEEAERPRIEERLAQARQDYYGRLRVVFPEFFEAPTFDRIAAAAQDAPLVYLLATPAGGLALVVQGGGGDDHVSHSE